MSEDTACLGFYKLRRLISQYKAVISFFARLYNPKRFGVFLHS